MTTYEQFLAVKACADVPSGLVDVPDLHHALKPFQRDLVAWALRRGRAGMRPVKRPEQALQQAVMLYLRRVLPPDAVAFAVPNGGARTPAEAGILKSMGVVAGIPDLAIVRGGYVYFIELKADGGALSVVQKEVFARLKAAESTPKVCRSLDEVEAALRGWHIPLRGGLA